MAQTASGVSLKPLGDRIVIKPSEKEEVTKSGLVLPDTAREKPQEGEVLAIGPGRILDNGTRLAVELKVGQKVLYAKYAGTEYKRDDDELLILRESDVLAVLSD
jgi:chaperonin GroES